MSEVNANPSSGVLAKALAGSWRPAPPALEISAGELKRIAPLLLGSGAAALGWWKVRHSDLKTSQAALQLQQAYRLYTLYAALREREIKQAFALLRSAGVDSLLIKGWAIARSYPEQALRPYGDLDLCVRPSQYALAEAALGKMKDGECPVDLHEGVTKLDDRSWDELYARTHLLRLGEVEVRVLSPEDHLRLLCVHLLRHGAWRPLWLCDIAAAVEFRQHGFDWDRCLGGNSRRADWVACAAGLAHRLLGAKIDDTPVAHRAKHLPRWLTATVLKQWEKPSPPIYYSKPVGMYLRDPVGLLKGLRSRWPNPIEATIGLNGPLNDLPRLPFQLGSCLSRAAQFLARLPEALREQHSRTLEVD